MLSAYNYKICYKPGADHANADGLSLLPVPDHVTNVPVPGDVLFLFQTLEGTPVRASQVWQWTDVDPVLSRVHHNILSGWIDTDEPELQPYQSRGAELSVQDGCLLRGSRVVVPIKGGKGNHHIVATRRSSRCYTNRQRTGICRQDAWGISGESEVTSPGSSAPMGVARPSVGKDPRGLCWSSQGQDDLSDG